VNPLVLVLSRGEFLAMAAISTWSRDFISVLGLPMEAFAKDFSYATGCSGSGGADHAMEELFQGAARSLAGCETDAARRQYFMANFAPRHMLRNYVGDYCDVCGTACMRNRDDAISMFIAGHSKNDGFSATQDDHDLLQAIRSSGQSYSLVLETVLSVRLPYKVGADSPTSWREHVACYATPLAYIKHVITVTHPGMIIEDLALSAKSYRLPAVKGKLYILACKCEPMELASACQSILAMATEESRSNMLDVHSSVEQTGLDRIELPRLDEVFGAWNVCPSQAEPRSSPTPGQAEPKGEPWVGPRVIPCGAKGEPWVGPRFIQNRIKRQKHDETIK
jgi:hypothetical protein